MNYHHWGEPKRWYAVPAQAMHLFEEAFKKALPGKFDKQPDLLFHLVTMLSPRILRSHGVPVYATYQVRQAADAFPGHLHSEHLHSLQARIASCNMMLS